MYIVKIIKRERFSTRASEYKKVSETGNAKDGGPIYEYVTAPAEDKIFESEIFSQHVQDLNLFDVIKAVNGEQKAATS